MVPIRVAVPFNICKHVIEPLYSKLCNMDIIKQQNNATTVINNYKCMPWVPTNDTVVLKSYCFTVKAAPNECVIRTDLP